MSRTVNGIGWEVQAYCPLTGWSSCVTILLCNKFDTKEDAQAAMDSIAVWDNLEYRVYERLL